MKALRFMPAALALSCLVGSVQSAHAQSVPAPDRMFMHKAAQGGMAEVKLGELARRNGASDTVRRFGGRMVRDHSHANDVLKGLARRKHVVLPGDIGGKNQAVYNRLSRLSGPAFDRAYMRDMVEDHQEDVAEFRKASLTARDPDVRRFAASTLPTLQAHLMMAREGARTVSMRGGHGVMRRGRM